MYLNPTFDTVNGGTLVQGTNGISSMINARGTLGADVDIQAICAMYVEPLTTNASATVQRDLGIVFQDTANSKATGAVSNTSSYSAHMVFGFKRPNLGITTRPAGVRDWAILQLDGNNRSSRFNGGQFHRFFDLVGAATYTVTDAARYVRLTAGNTAVEMPDAADNFGRVITFRNDSGSNTTITSTHGDTFRGSTTLTNGASQTWVAGNGNWNLMAT